MHRRTVHDTFIVAAVELMIMMMMMVVVVVVMVVVVMVVMMILIIIILIVVYGEIGIGGGCRTRCRKSRDDAVFFVVYYVGIDGDAGGG